MKQKKTNFHVTATHFIMTILLVILLSAAPAAATELKFTTQEFAPFSYDINGVTAGPAVDVIQLICKEMGVTCSFKLYPWTRAQKMVEKGKANGMFVIGWNEERAKSLYFTPPLLMTEYGFFVKESMEMEYDKPEKVKGLTVAVYGPSNTSCTLEKIKDSLGGDLTIDMRYDDESGFKKLSAGRVDAVFSNRDVGYALIKKIGLENIKYAGAHKNLKYYIGFSKQFNDKSVIDKFNSTFLELHQQGKIQSILTSYFLEPAMLQ